MMSKTKKWIACLVAALLVFQAVPAFMEDGEFVSNVMIGSLAGFRDVMEIISEGGSYMLTDETVTLTTNEDYTPDWSVENSNVATVESGATASHSAVIKAVGFGETKVTAVDGKQTAVYTITVINPDEYETKADATEGEELPEGEKPEDGEEIPEEDKTKMVIVINGGTMLTHYNGEDQVFGEYTATSSSDLFDDSKVQVKREIEVTGKDCGYYMMNLAEDDFSYDDKTVNAIFVINDGYMKITPAKATVEADNLTKDAGQEDPELTATISGVFGEDTLEYTLTRDEGEEEGYYRISVEGEGIQGNYRVNYVSGLLTITKPQRVMDKSKMSVSAVSDWPEGQTGYPGAKITLTAVLVGFEGWEYTLQWQYSTDLQNWTDEPGANDMTYTYELDDTTSQYKWRVVVRNVH